MDRPSAQSQVPGAPTPGRRDMMFCHECHDEWYRDERGLTCPECGSDFTEIIEDDNDPRDVGHDDDDDDDNESMPDVDAPHHPFHQHNPWQHDDPDEADISDLQWRQVGPGRIAVTLNRTISPPAQGQGATASAMGTFASLLNSIMAGAGAGLASSQRAQENQGHESQDAGQQGQQGQQEQQEQQGQQGTPGVRTGSGTLPGGHRFRYSSNVRLIPGDGDRAANLYPQDDMNNFLVGILTSLGGEPAAHHHHHDHDEDDQFLPHPFMNLFAQLMPGHGQAGDFVYSQEALDRIVSQLMEQTATSSAPGPAAQSDIDGLARKAVTTEMLGPEGTAECSICMDSVAVGDQVTELPCHHWFHHACVAAWLSEHDTCPHCRKGISSRAPSGEEEQEEAARAMPGGFGAAGEAEPVVVHESSSQGTRGEPSRTGSTEESGGFGERLRRGLFGPPG